MFQIKIRSFNEVFMLSYVTVFCVMKHLFKNLINLNVGFM